MKQQPQVIVVRESGTANALAAICNFFIPGLGHLIQVRVIGALFWFVVMCIAYGIAAMTMGVGLVLAIPLHIVCILSAAAYKRQ